MEGFADHLTNSYISKTVVIDASEATQLLGAQQANTILANDLVFPLVGNQSL